MTQPKASFFPSTRSIGSVAELASRDPTAWLKFDKLYHEPVLQFCRRRELAYDDGEEIYSELCLRLLRWNHLSDSTRQFRPRLVAILLHLIADHRRSKGRFRNLLSRMRSTVPSSQSTVTGAIEDDLEDIAGLLKRIQIELGLTEQVLNAVLWYDKVNDKSIKAYADRLGLSPNVIYKARIKVLDYLTDRRKEKANDN